MKYLMSFLFLSLLGCQSSPKATGPQSEKTAAKDDSGNSTIVYEVPANALGLDQALSQSEEETLQYLHAQVQAKPYEGEQPGTLVANMPASLKFEKTASQRQIEKSAVHGFLKKFKPWTLEKKSKRAEALLESFSCEKAFESQAMGFSLERDYPETKAITLSESLHEKVITCEGHFKQESYFRLIVFSIQKGNCIKALDLAKQFPVTPEKGVSDRLIFLQGLCSPVAVENQRNPWTGYGVKLGELKLANTDKQLWYLSSQSGKEEWDRLLATLLDLTRKNEKRKVQFVASKLNYENFRTLPHSFQASILLLLHYSGADLSIFQTLHRYLTEHPTLVTREVVPLLFPIRYWREIVENSKGMDPILVKSLIRQESAFNPEAHSRARAMGLMQMIYPTAKIYGVKKQKQLLDPQENIRAGSEFLNKLIEKFGSVELALAAYNAGPDHVRDWLKRYPTDNIDLFVEMIPYAETREYVRLVSRNYRIYQSLLGDQIPQRGISGNHSIQP